MRSLFFRLLCLCFGHRPDAITVTLEQANGEKRQEFGDALAVFPLPGAPPFVFNLCRCGALVQHPLREEHWARVVQMRAQQALAEKDAKAAADAAATAAKNEKKLKRKN